MKIKAVRIKIPLAAIAFFSLFSLESLGNTNSLYFHELSPVNGLSSSMSTFFFRDSYGFTWIGSVDGLNLYNGKKVVVYKNDPNNPHTISDNNIQSNCIEDDQGNLWFSTYTGFHRFNRKKKNFDRFFIQNQKGAIIRTDYRVISLDSKGILWLRANNELYLFDTKKEAQLRQLHNFTGIRSFVVKGPKGEVMKIIAANWIKGEGFDIYHYDQSYQKIDIKHHKMEEVTINNVISESDSTIWLSAGVHGLMLFNINTQKTIEKYPSYKNRPIFCSDFQELNDNSLLIATKGQGLLLFDKAKKQFVHQWKNSFYEKNSISSDNIFSLYLDNYRVLWLSLPNYGVNYSATSISNSKFKSYFENTEINSIIQKSKDNLYLVTADQGVWQFNSSTLERKNIFSPNIIETSRIEQIHFDYSGKMWVLTRHGIHVLDRNHQIVNYIPPPINSIYPRAMIELSDHKKLVTFSNGVFELISNQFKKMSDFEEGFSSHCVFRDSRGRLYFNNNSNWLEVYEYKKEKLNLIQKKEILARVYCIFEDFSSGIIYLGTSDGLVLLDKNLKVVKDKYIIHLFKKSSIFSITQDRKKTIWFATNNGLYRWDGALFRLSNQDGLLSNECRSLYYDGKNNLYIAGSKGLNQVNILAVKKRLNRARIKTSEIKINYLPIDLPKNKSLKLSYQNNTLSLSFNAIDDHYATGYQYQMEPYDNTWKESEKGYAYYPKIQPGTYTFYVRASNQNGVWTKPNKILNVKILPPFWQTWWFISISLVFLLAIIYTIYQYRIKQIKKELLFKQKVIESEMKALRAQMNPHFIFNSLNSINAFILAHQTTLATEYLTQFANLIRQILDYSAKDIISLEHEIEFLGNYLQIESIRMQNKLSYSIDISPEIDTFETEIPSLVLQPYIENAIWHGISKRPEGGTVSISIHRNSQTLTLSVEDNGVGRTQSQQQVKKQHSSKGLHITAERLALYAEKYQKQVEVQILDLFDGNVPAGTKVNISISSG